MRFYQQQHQYYCGVDLHARSMYLHILDADKRTLLDEDLPAEPAAFLDAVAPYRLGLVVGAVSGNCARARRRGVSLRGNVPISLFAVARNDYNLWVIVSKPFGGHLMLPTPVKPLPEMPAESVEKRFHRLAEVWHRATEYFSSMDASNRHPAYQEIIRLGPDVVPLLLRDMQENHTHWFAALEAITGARPLSPELAGNIPKMVDAWLKWAKDHGYQ